MFLIRNYKAYDEETGEPLYWSNVDGWVDYSSATRFTEEEMRQFGLPADGIWEQSSVVVVFGFRKPIILETYDTDDTIIRGLQTLSWPKVSGELDEDTGEYTVIQKLHEMGIKHYRIIRYNQIGG